MNIGTFHAYGGWSPAYEFGARALRGYADRLHGRIAVSAAARHFIDRYFPGDYKVIPNGVDIDALPARRAADALAGRDAEHPVRRPVRAPQGRPGPAQGVPDPAQDRLRLPAAARGRRAAGARGAALRGHAPAAGRRVPRPRLGRRAEPAVPDRRRLLLAGDGTGVVRDRAARGDGGGRARSSPRTSTATRAWSGAAARRSSSRRKEPKELAAALGRLLQDRELAASMSASGLVRAEEFSWPRVTAKVDDYYGFVIRRLAATGTLPAHFTAADAAVAPGRARRGLTRDPTPTRSADPGSRSAPCAADRTRRSGRPVSRPAHRPRRPAPAPGARPRPSRRRRRRRRRGTPPGSRTCGSANEIAPLAVDRVHAELERVQVGRQQPLVGVDDGGRQRERRDVRVEDHEPRRGRGDQPGHEPPRVARREDLERDEAQRDRHDERDDLGDDPVIENSGSPSGKEARDGQRGAARRRGEDEREQVAGS